MILKLLLVAAVVTTTSSLETCDPTCLTCSTRYPLDAVPCDDHDPNQHGFAPSTSGGGGGGFLRRINYDSALVSGCVTWNAVINTMELSSPCAATAPPGTPTDWINATRGFCSSFNLTKQGYVGAGEGCNDNENKPEGCLDIKRKVGPELQLTQCYDQPNDNLTFTSSGAWNSHEQLPTYPRRCVRVSKKICTRAGCCETCPPGRHLDVEGFCALDAVPPPSPRKAYIFLAITSNATAVDNAIAELAKHRASFTGVAFQYFSVCGAANNVEHRCADKDAVGPAHLAPGNMGGDDPGNMALAATLPDRLRKVLGMDLDVVPMISFGGTNDTTMLQQLFNTPSLTDAFIDDALVYANKYNVTGFNFDFEPTTQDSTWMRDAQPFLALFAQRMKGAGYETSWDSNGYEGVAYDVDTWVDMGTYGYEPGEAYKYMSKQGLYAVGEERYGIGYCPTCQPLAGQQVSARFEWLTETPGKRIRTMWLWSFYGTGVQPPLVDGTDVWASYWPLMTKWLEG